MLGFFREVQVDNFGCCVFLFCHWHHLCSFCSQEEDRIGQIVKMKKGVAEAKRPWTRHNSCAKNNGRTAKRKIVFGAPTNGAS